MKLQMNGIFCLLVVAAASAASPRALAKVNLVEATQKTTESQIRRLIEPLLEKYCPEQCKLMSVNSVVEIATPDEVAPGFDEVDRAPAASLDLSPTSARIKILMDDKVGPVSRGKLLELVQQVFGHLGLSRQNRYPVSALSCSRWN